MDNASRNKNISVSALGDIAFVGELDLVPSSACFDEVRSTWSDSHLVIGNLEGPLLENADAVPGKCVLKGKPGWAPILSEIGIDVVSLANNHMMDYGVTGLESTMQALREAGVLFLGAGCNQAEANAPLIFERGGICFGLLARSSVIVNSPAYASATQAGVAFFDEEETLAQVKRLRGSVDYIILLLHWGLENYHLPSPSQRTLAKTLLANGVDLLIGHHPHVLQGAERHEGRLVSYSLGNFLFDDFKWSFCDQEGKVCPQQYTLSPANRMGSVLTVTCQDGAIIDFHHVLTKIRPNGLLALVDKSGSRYFFELLSKALKIPWYDQWWKIYAIRREWVLRVGSQITWRKLFTRLWKVRPSHVRSLIRTIRTSSDIVKEKTTNPYD